MKTSKINQNTMLEIIKQGIVKVVHDCSKGGIAVTLSELCISNEIGCTVVMDKIPSENLRTDEVLFSESHSRYLFVIEPDNEKKVKSILEQKGVKFAIIGKFYGQNITFEEKSKTVVGVRVDKAQNKWLNSLGLLVTHG